MFFSCHVLVSQVSQIIISLHRVCDTRDTIACNAWSHAKELFKRMNEASLDRTTWWMNVSNESKTKVTKTKTRLNWRNVTSYMSCHVVLLDLWVASIGWRKGKLLSSRTRRAFLSRFHSECIEVHRFGTPLSFGLRPPHLEMNSRCLSNTPFISLSWHRNKWQRKLNHENKRREEHEGRWYGALESAFVSLDCSFGTLVTSE